MIAWFNEWLWLLQLLFGMFLAYYCLSPRLRRMVNPLLRRLWFGKPTRISRPVYRAATPSSAMREAVASVLAGARSHNFDSTRPKVVVSEEQLEKWLKRNPQLTIRRKS